MNKKISITADSGANLKLLKGFERQGLINITAVNLENGKLNKVSNKVGPVGVYGKSKWGDGSVYGSEDNIYKQLLSIVGGNNYQDARHLEMPSRFLCNAVRREDAKSSPGLASGLFC